MKDSLVIFIKGVNQDEEEGGMAENRRQKEEGRKAFNFPKFLTRFSSTYFKRADVDSPQVKEIQRRKNEKKAKLQSLSNNIF
jgi:hypothetical protein